MPMSYGSPPPPPPPPRPPPGGYGGPPPPQDGGQSGPYGGGYSSPTPPPPAEGSHGGAYGGGYSGPPAPPPQPGYGMPAQGFGAPVRNQNALISLICGIVGFLCFGVVLGPLAIVFSRKAQAEIAASGGRQTGEGMAKAGFILGIVALVLWAIGLIYRLASN